MRFFFVVPQNVRSHFILSKQDKPIPFLETFTEYPSNKKKNQKSFQEMMWGIIPLENKKG